MELVEEYRCELGSKELLKARCGETSPEQNALIALRMMNCALRAMGRRGICEDALSPEICIQSLRGEELVILNSHLINFRNMCAYFKILQLERRNGRSLIRMTRFHSKMENLLFTYQKRITSN